jgi:hypothetical protein
MVLAHGFAFLQLVIIQTGQITLTYGLGGLFGGDVQYALQACQRGQGHALVHDGGALTHGNELATCGRDWLILSFAESGFAGGLAPEAVALPMLAGLLWSFLTLQEIDKIAAKDQAWSLFSE